MVAQLVKRPSKGIGVFPLKDLKFKKTMYINSKVQITKLTIANGRRKNLVSKKQKSFE